MKRVAIKIGNMRKDADFIVYPYKAGQTSLFIQSDKRCALVEIDTGRCVLSAPKNYPNRTHLTLEQGATLCTLPRFVIEACLAAQPRSGDRIGAVGVIA